MCKCWNFDSKNTHKMQGWTQVRKLTSLGTSIELGLELRNIHTMVKTMHIVESSIAGNVHLFNIDKISSKICIQFFVASKSQNMIANYAMI